MVLTAGHPRHDQMFPILEPRDIERLKRFGWSVTYPAGTQIAKTGSLAPGFVLLLSGKVEVSQQTGLDQREPIVTHPPGSFMGELDQLSGRPALVDARREAGRGARHPVGAPARRPGRGGRARRAHHARADPAPRRPAPGAASAGPCSSAAPRRRHVFVWPGFLSRNGQPHQCSIPARLLRATLVEHFHVDRRSSRSCSARTDSC